MYILTTMQINVLHNVLHNIIYSWGGTHISLFENLFVLKDKVSTALRNEVFVSSR